MIKTLKLEFELSDGKLNTKFTCDGLSNMEIIGVLEGLKYDILNDTYASNKVKEVTPVTSDTIENWWETLDDNIKAILIIQYCPQYQHLNVPLLDLEKIYNNEVNNR